jgi:membrane protease YdiL (CAAX protease family)
MGIYIEALILYIVLFFSGSVFYNIPEVVTPFSIYSEIYKILFILIPSTALIWCFLLKNPLIRIKPEKNELTGGLIALFSLLITGFSISFVSSFVGGNTQFILSSPTTIAGFFVLFISCICTGYLEESFFRFYLLTKRHEMNLSAPAALILSTALFSICHIYLGPFGFLNSVISGFVLAFIFLRYGSFHGIAIAHGLFNFIAYLLNTIFYSNL